MKNSAIQCPNCKSKVVSSATNTVERGKEYVCPVCGHGIESANHMFKYIIIIGVILVVALSIWGANGI
ncbi:MAG: hypothetical protein ABJJ44_18700 [Paraglaciecola sp.]|uniref:hypothetical protein n=1 Tax=Paraglaciecola sp. TaxID=1920173 RepID=UPI003298DF63